MDSETEFFASLSNEMTGFYYAHLSNPDGEQLLEDEFTGKQLKLYRKWKEDEAASIEVSGTATAKELQLMESKIQSVFENLSSTIREMDARIRINIEDYDGETNKKLDQLEQRVEILDEKQESRLKSPTSTENSQKTMLVYLKCLIERLQKCKIDEVRDGIAAASIGQIRDILEQFFNDKEIAILCCKILHTITRQSSFGASIVTSYGCLNLLPKVTESFVAEGLNVSNAKLFREILWMCTRIVDESPELSPALEQDDIVNMLVLPINDPHLTVVASNVLARILARSSAEFRNKHEVAIEEYVVQKLTSLPIGCSVGITMDRNDYQWCLGALETKIPAVMHYAAWMIANDKHVSEDAERIMHSLNGDETVAIILKVGELRASVRAYLLSTQ